MPDKVRVRIAPSPTGNLHVGTARTALYNYLFARHHGGSFIMRLEDTDEARSSESYTQDIIQGLKWLNLTWDEGPDIGGPYGPYRQTDKVDHYNRIANKLIATQKAYLCFCSPAELEELKEEQKNTGRAPQYDNRCRNLTQDKIQQLESQGRVPAVRFMIDECKVISWDDGIKGVISIQASDLGGDMVIVKSNGVAIYNFAVVVDDLDMKVTHVIRGEDHIHNTAKQLLLYEALNEQPPVFAHPSLIFDIERRKLSKRHHGEAVHVERYRLDGYMPEAMVNYLAQMSWTHPEGEEIYTLEEACRTFDLARVSKSPAVFDLKRLQWFNGHYLRSLPLELITDRALPYLTSENLSEYPPETIREIVASVREGLTMLSEITESTRFYFGHTVQIPEELKKTILSTEPARTVLSQFLLRLNQLPWGNHASCKATVDAMGRELGLKGKELYWPLRAALSGTVKGPDLGSIISILGETRVKSRIESAMEICCRA